MDHPALAYERENRGEVRSTPFSTAPVHRSCPNCHERQEIYLCRRRTFFERFCLALFDIRPMRCMQCGARFYRRILKSF